MPSSIFEKFRAGKKVAHERQIKQPKTDQSDAAAVKPPPYRHVPTHARADALVACGGGYGEIDREKIRDQKRRKTSTDPRNGGWVSPARQRPSTFYGNPWSERGEMRPRAEQKMKRVDSSYGRSPLSSVEASPHLSEAGSTTSSSSRDDFGEGSVSTTTARTSASNSTVVYGVARQVRHSKPTASFNDVVTVAHIPTFETAAEHTAPPAPRPAAAEPTKPKRKWGFARKRQSLPVAVMV
ncbi:MAG: hypothetical protein M1837_004546 [Sclerophora amabilis]|nr:MAG: hypothetical protein M1837_004546 [Sclerophora amabilis]